ncbi:conserved hypothetical protein [Rippkaea orientalis PCC 8801]|uniref:Restriction endonuclease domain-containing protein n=1 Tax=Rippkaea orientalis (strain PCC 8801 / RF-1) TaxID=41431 RepID=B7K1M8_RIPO1|nr:Uma2 family endonuclease [Rippkaea orientalis]ACK67570.1 conserved hypothetical protein [Rippkaea orientalis PCC 8801]
MKDVTWQEFEQILQKLGEHRSAKIAYDHYTLKIMIPVPEHEILKQIIGDLIKALLEDLDVDVYPLGSATFKNPSMKQTIKPDSCFYLANEVEVREN